MVFGLIKSIFKVAAPIVSTLFPATAPFIAGIGKAISIFDQATSSQLARAGTQVASRSQGSPQQTLDDVDALGTNVASWGRVDLSQSALVGKG